MSWIGKHYEALFQDIDVVHHSIVLTLTSLSGAKLWLVRLHGAKPRRAAQEVARRSFEKDGCGRVRESPESNTLLLFRAK